MKKYLLSCWLLLSLFTALAQEGFTLRINVNDTVKYIPYLSYTDSKDQSMVERNFTLNDGQMVFKGKVNELSFAHFGLRFKNQSATGGAPASSANNGMPSPPRPLILTNTVITVTVNEDGKVNKASVNGGKLNKEYDIALAKMEKYQQEENAKIANSSEPVDQMSLMLNIPAKLRFIDENPESIASVYYLSSLRTTLSLDVLKAAYSKLNPKYKNIRDGKLVSDLIENLEATSAGKMAIEINKKDMNGNQVNLQTLKGKYVLLDFWGSWCGPCRASHPHLKELYSKYKDKGFEIVGVADEHERTLEDNNKKWRKAIEEDGIPWIQVLNNEGQEVFDAVKAYGISAFPTKVLLDKEGKVIARYIGASIDFDKKLEEIFGY